MLARVLILAVALGASSTEEHYSQQAQEQPKEYNLHYEQASLKDHQEPTPIQYQETPEIHSNPAYSSQSIVHHADQPQSQENAGHVAPVYEYVPVSEEQLSHHAVPHHKLQAIQFVPVHHQSEPTHTPVHHESQPIHVPVHHKVIVAHQHVPLKIHQAQNHIPLYHQQGDSHSHAHEEPIDYYAHPKYQYEYKVDDPHTGDNKYQHEIRDGDVVKGVYSVHEADGSIRTVEYTSDKHHGFNAIVKHSAPGQHVYIESHHH